MQNKVMARVLATMMAATAAVSTASVPMMVAPIVAMADDVVATPTKPISVSGVESGATVKAYRLVEGEYDSTGKLTGYKLTTLASGVQYEGADVKVTDLAKTADTEPGNTDALAAWTALVAQKIATNSTAATYDLTTTDSGENCTYSKGAEPGLYLILITKADTDTTYNPVLLAVNVSDANQVSSTISGSTVNAATDFFQNGTTKGYAKKTTNGLTKSIVSGGTTAKAVTAAVGETVSFKLDGMTIPAYSAQYTNPKYVITDTLEANCFDNISKLTVKVGGTTIYENGAFKEGYDGAFSLTGGNGTTSYTITFDFAKDCVKNLSNKEASARAVEITYESKLVSTSGLNFAENYNHAKLEYNYFDTNNTMQTKTVYDNTYVYTFGIDANIDSEDAASSYGDYTLNKVSVASGSAQYEQASDDGVTTKKSPNAIVPVATANAAEFTLYAEDGSTVATCNETNGVAAANSNGHIKFTGLKPGTYILKETKAPKGYVLSTTTYKIVIAATFDEDDASKLKSYTITTYSSDDNYAQAVGTTTVTASAGTLTESTGDIAYTVSATTTPVEIINTTLQQLPFTGGAGRYAIYIGSVALAAVFVVLFIVWRRREQDE